MFLRNYRRGVLLLSAIDYALWLDMILCELLDEDKVIVGDDREDDEIRRNV